jgi:hypothetical protein
VVVSIVIDLSQEECLYSLQYWLSIAKQLRVAHPNLSLPLAVIAAKSDLLNLSDGENLIKARSLQGRLRLLCLKGLSPLFFPPPSIHCTQPEPPWSSALPGSPPPEDPPRPLPARRQLL